MRRARSLAPANNGPRDDDDEREEGKLCNWRKRHLPPHWVERELDSCGGVLVVLLAGTTYTSTFFLLSL